MMVTSRRPPGLLVHNRANGPVRLRFRCGAHALWDAWVPLEGHIALPDPGQCRMAGYAALLDTTGAGYRRPFELPSHGVSVRASMVIVDRALDFQLVVEPARVDREIVLVNDCRGAVEFGLRWLGTPFHLGLWVPAGTNTAVNLDQLQMSATADGITTSAAPLTPWARTWTVHQGLGRDDPVQLQRSS